ncbi:hypothetical protein NIES593_05145 [Hydrococcus rivularis NIES-593]|uniref:Uncharacterized protein n=1 Tax=Hydrococcus rivularis NIES-593 TaxID=1921803 RepID=A0A1U7HNI1_9CYAN|nr:hypothetical protein [Hydrococcus rivularis]OKH25152.1 hypothetical protein NIES593_05145 [Hydrococcus rivularis NIES-593]
MSERILHQAQAWGFLCQRDGLGNWLIYPKKRTERWQLSQAQAGERWLLVVGGVPQMNMTTEEVLVFLECRLR